MAELTLEHKLSCYFIIISTYATAFHGMKDLRRVKTASTDISKLQQGLSTECTTKCMGAIVDDFQPVFACYFLNLFNVARIAIDMSGHDGLGILRNGCF